MASPWKLGISPSAVAFTNGVLSEALDMLVVVAVVAVVVASVAAFLTTCFAERGHKLVGVHGPTYPPKGGVHIHGQDNKPDSLNLEQRGIQNGWLGASVTTGNKIRVQPPHTHCSSTYTSYVVLHDPRLYCRRDGGLTGTEQPRIFSNSTFLWIPKKFSPDFSSTSHWFTKTKPDRRRSIPSHNSQQPSSQTRIHIVS